MDKRVVMWITGSLLLSLLLPVVLSSSLTIGSSPIEHSVVNGNIVHEGNLTIADSEVFIIEDCFFQQNGSVLVKDNATLMVKNSQFYQTCATADHIILADTAQMLIENSSFYFSQSFDVKISVFNDSLLNITDSTIENSPAGLWIWMERNALLHMYNSNLLGSGDGSRVITDQQCAASIRDSALDMIVCWGVSTVNVSGSTVRKGVKTWSLAKAYVYNSVVDFVWAYQSSRAEFWNTTIYSTSPYESALRAIEDANVYFFSCSLDDNVNVASMAKVRLRDSSTRNVSAYDDAVVWLVNSTADNTYVEDNARIYNFSSLQGAINNANEGESIPIPFGVYHESITVNKTVSLIGEDGESTYIVGNGTGTVVSIEANNVLLSEFTVQNGEDGLDVDSADNVTIEDCTVEGNMNGVLLNRSSNCTLASNEILNSSCALSFWASNSSLTVANNVSDNDFAIVLNISNGNYFHHNNLLNDTNQVYSADSMNNAFDDGYEGNYWSDYTQEDLDHDGIGDSPYMINLNTEDSYPLMGFFHGYWIQGEATNVISNSTIEAFDYYLSNHTIKIRVSNSTSDQTYGFCRVSFPLDLINADNVAVVIDNGLVPVLYPNYSLLNNGTHAWICFFYEHSARELDIVSEFPSILLPFTMATLVLVIAARRKRTYRSRAVSGKC